MSKIFNEYFSRVAESIGKPDIIGANEPVATVVNRRSEHPSVKAINLKISIQTHRNLSLVMYRWKIL